MKWSRLLFSFSFCFLHSASDGQVNLQNGAAHLSIPLFSYSDAGNRLGLNVSLDYVDGNGLKVSEVASSVGTGWTLNCGGYISRIQHGEPDDQEDTVTYSNYTQDFAPYVSNYYPNGYLCTTSLPTDIIDNGGAYIPYVSELPSNQKNYLPPEQYLADRDQDIFQFNFNGRTGEFVIGKNLQPVTLEDSKLQISFQQTNMISSGIRTRISQFTITDEAGIQYVFKDLELAYVCQYTDLRVAITDNANIDQLVSQPISEISTFVNNGNSADVVLGVPNGQFVVSKWYLSQIINPLTGVQITFNYTTYEEDFKADKVMNNVETNNTFSNVTVMWNRYKVRGKRLSSVVCSPNEQLNITYSSSPRIDLPNENALSHIMVNYKGNPVYSWNFGYGYMVGIDGTIKSPADSYSPTEIQWSRLCLMTLQKSGYNDNGFIPISEPPYQFAYNMGGDNNADADVIPPMFSIYQDSYGYYNAGVAQTTASEGSETSFYTISGLNSFVTNGLGNYRDVYSTVAKNGIIKSVTYPLGGVLTYTYENNSTPSGSIGGVRVNQMTQFDGVSHANDIIKQYKYLNSDESTSSGWGGETFTYTQTANMTADGCTTSEQPAMLVKGLANYFAQRGVLAAGTSAAAALPATSALSATVTELSEIADLVGIAYEIVSLLQGSTPPTVNSTYTIRQTQSLQANNRLPWGYTRTEEISVLNSVTAGKTVYTYSNPIRTGERPIDVPTLSVPYSNRPRYVPWAYGWPETITVYDNTGNIVKQTVNHYTYIVNTLTNANYESSSWAAIGSEYGCTFTTGDETSTLISQETYYQFTGHAQLNSTDVTIYNSSQQLATVTTNYDYDNNFQLMDKYSLNSRGEKVQTFYYYPYTYSTAPSAIATMNNGTSNILNIILSTETYLTDLSGNIYMVAASATSYFQALDADLKPQISYTFESTVPVSNNVLQPFSTFSVVRDPTFYIQVSSYSYDNNGNVVQVITAGNRIISNIYDYDGKLPVATASNASYNDIGYTSFEAEGGKPGSWINTAAITSTDSRTGNSCFNLSDPSTSTKGYFGFSTFNSSLNYIVSFWSKNGTPCLTGSKSGNTVVSTCQGGSAWKQGTTINGWTYYEVQVNNIDQISVSGTGLIDEFRIYPVGAQMSTTTYLPLVGKTSECDAANKVIYYQYDELDRLKYVLDDQKNVIKMYDYNYQQ